jgi:hypothetical protein
MGAIFDRLGDVVGWLDEGAIFDPTSRRWVAFVTDDLVLTPGGHVLGFCRLGFFRDRRGGAVAFTREASRGPEVPADLPKLAPPTLPPKPARARQRLRSLPPLPVAGVRWGTDWWSFIHGAPVLSQDKLDTKTKKAA